ncbi:2,3-dehydroadipyl-CoA hydratase [Variovorax sp. SRS16]|uniref:enoyl-CoA hydratase/isomerase family protein n=1 Tax=Variovorax sp. SRS16 TaxID=282217 RepID=UPI00131722B9|nr:enoyl-CoA hydratase-related protein [Variovorax sp. SRS16]VTU29774.1 2,3-dehydroadipyl-CoA hydratase [Variovorax sp. SRS16]
MRAYETLLAAPQDEHVLLVTLNRPELLNALNTQMGLDLVDLFESIAQRPGALRCVVLTGAGAKGFCAGGDLKQRDGMSSEAWTTQHLIFERMARALLDCPLPVIGAINGAAFGGGCEIAGCCDFLYAADHARFALPEARLGIMPGAGGTQTLPRAIGERLAKEYILTGKPFTAMQAQQWGLVNEVMPLDALLARALETARLIAGSAPLSTRQIKHSVSRGLGMALKDALVVEIEAYNHLVPTKDRVEGVKAFNEKRKPSFKGE